MKKTFFTFIVLFIFASGYNGILSQQQQDRRRIILDPPFKLYTNTQMISDIVYGQGGGRDLLLDLYLPKKGFPPYPAIVFIHGGGWHGGTKNSQVDRQASYLADKGIVCVSIDYRLADEAKFPAAIEDCKAAVRWVRANAKKYNIDPDKIAAAGNSAGGHLATLLGTSGGVKELEGTGGNPEYSSRVNMVISLFGPTDFNELVKHSRNREVVPSFLGGTPEEIPEQYKLASSVTHVDGSDPPFLIFHGTDDPVVPLEQSLKLKELLEKVGVPVKMYTIEGQKHGYNDRPPYFYSNLARIEEFIKETFK